MNPDEKAILRLLRNVKKQSPISDEGRCVHRGFWIAVAIIAMVFGGPAKGQFVNGVENFNGTSVDNNTWVPYTFGNGAATVANGYLDLTGQYYLTTRMPMVGVGNTVSAR